jgi:hypothetical protein
VAPAGFGGGVSVFEHAPVTSADVSNNVETIRISIPEIRPGRYAVYRFFAVFRRAAPAGRAARAEADFFDGFFTLAAAFARTGCARLAAT